MRCTPGGTCSADTGPKTSSRECARRIVLIFVCGALLQLGAATGAQTQRQENGNLRITVNPQIQLEAQGADLVLKIRLAPGTSVTLWADDACGSPGSGSTFSSSGTYRVAVQNFAAQGHVYACAASSDGLLAASIHL
ncbi:MAG TPA: hypothetical protein VKV15_05990 [Bryobacteraceae bacterium]|nr:hypothetical protein [Bryobacteraceae bacterium]